MSGDLRAVALMRAKPGEESAGRRAILGCVGPSRGEAGALSYVAHVDRHNPSLFVVVEHWASVEARERHLKTDHFNALTQAVDGQGQLVEHVFHVLDPFPPGPGARP